MSVAPEPGDRVTRTAPSPVATTRWRALLVGAATVAAIAPLGTLAARIAVQKPAVPLYGDQAVVQLAAINAGHHAQLLGPYSRFGWHHPGPSWFYLLDAAFLPLGSHGWSLLVATLLIQAAFAGAVVLLLARWRGAVAALAGAALLLLFFRSLGADQLVTPWNPYAVVLPCALLLLLGGAAASGSPTALLGLVLVGSFMVQTDVGTLPAVAAIGVVATLLALRNHLHPLRDDAALAPFIERRSRTWRQRAGLAAALTPAPLILLMWVPPLIDQATNNPGNIRALKDFFSTAHGDHTVAEGLSAVARELVVFPFGHYDTSSRVTDGTIPLSRWLVLVVFVALCVVLIVVGQRLSDRLAQGVGACCLVMAGTAVWSVTRVTGPLDAYLVTWVTAITLALFIGYAAALPAALRRVPWADGGRLPSRLRAAGPAAISALAVAAILPVSLSGFTAIRADAQSPSGSGDIQSAVSAAVRALPAGAIRVEPAPGALAWPTATGITVRLLQDGRSIQVPAAWVFLWGDQFRPRNQHLAARVLVVGSASAAATGATLGAHPVATGLGLAVFVVGG